MLICWTTGQTKCIALNCDNSMITETVEEEIQFKKKKAHDFQEVISIHAADLDLFSVFIESSPYLQYRLQNKSALLEEKLQ